MRASAWASATGAGASSSSAAIRPTDARAAAPVEATLITAPAPAASHQNAWVAPANCAAAPRLAVLAIVPPSATPSDAPICRLVDATAAATLAWVRGNPDTAVFVIGGLDRPKADAEDRNAATSHGKGVAAVRLVDLKAPVATATPASTSDGRVPCRPTADPISARTPA